MKTKSIGTIGNYYGNLEVAQKDGLFYWGIENWNGTLWEEIPQVLYDQLVAYEDERIKFESQKTAFFGEEEIITEIKND